MAGGLGTTLSFGGGVGGFGSTSANPLAANPSQYSGLILQSGNDILNLKGQAAANNMQATAEGYAVQGANLEATTYGNAATTAENNAAVEAASQKVQNYQERRMVGSTVGTLRAEQGGNGFTISGTGLNLIRSSFQQGDLARQIIAVNSNLAQEGYLGQAMASRGEQAAAQVSGSAAAALQSSYASTASTLSTEAANETAALTGILALTGNVSGTPGSPGAATTPAGALATTAISGGSTNNLQWYHTSSGWQYGDPNSGSNSGGSTNNLQWYHTSSGWQYGDPNSGSGDMRGNAPIGIPI